MRYVSRPTECEAMQWRYIQHEMNGNSAEIVAWVNANGGEARYLRAEAMPNVPTDRIAIRTREGRVHAVPGDYVVMGDDWVGHIGEKFIGVRAFITCDPETFEKRWEAPRES
jgi:hypothetical protein